MIEAAVASYSLMTGIQVVYHWKYLKINSSHSIDFISSCSSNNTILSFFRTILMNSFQHDEQYFKTFPTTEINDRNSNMKVMASLFKPASAQGKLQTVYAFAFFINDKYQNINTVVNDLVKDNTVECAMIIQNILHKNEQLCTATKEVNFHAYQLSCIFHSGVENIHSISDIIESDSQDNFYAQVLWCHLFTQMTTILELDDCKPGEEIPLFNFLASFMLPFQLQLSDIKAHETPIPGFFLQIVEKQPGLPISTLLMFKRPWTWVRIGARQVICINNIEEHKSYSNQYLQTIKLNFDLQPSDAKERLLKKEIELINKDNFNEKWPTSVIGQLKKVPDQLRVSFARQILSELVQKAVILIQSINLFLKQKQQSFLNPPQFKDICSNFNIDDNEKDIVLSIANLFDSSILNRASAYRTQMLKQMVEVT